MLHRNINARSSAVGCNHIANGISPIALRAAGNVNWAPMRHLGNRDRCTDRYGPDRAWLGSSSARQCPIAGLMLIEVDEVPAAKGRIWSAHAPVCAHGGKKSLLLSR